MLSFENRFLLKELHKDQIEDTEAEVLGRQGGYLGFPKLPQITSR